MQHLLSCVVWCVLCVHALVFSTGLPATSPSPSPTCLPTNSSSSHAMVYLPSLPACLPPHSLLPAPLSSLPAHPIADCLSSLLPVCLCAVPSLRRAHTYALTDAIEQMV